MAWPELPQTAKLFGNVPLQEDAMPSCRLSQLMHMNVLGCTVWGMGLVLVTAVMVEAQSPQAPRRVASQTQMEEIYFARSVIESQIAPTQFCAPAKTGFGDAIAENRFSLRSISINTSDGRLLATNVNTIGSGRGCFGRTANPMIINAYLEFLIGSKAFTGIGECRFVKSDFPERGINEGHCFLDMSAPDDQYVGGLATTNSITSLKDVGLDTDPPGYTQASIVTLRVWKKRSQR